MTKEDIVAGLQKLGLKKGDNIGVHLGCCSSMHLAEKGIQLPQRIIDRMTPPPELAEKYKEENIGFGFGPYPDFALMEEPAKEHGITRLGRLWVSLGH